MYTLTNNNRISIARSQRKGKDVEIGITQQPLKKGRFRARVTLPFI